ncbi:MAG TPA: hypothetical protein VN730_07670 [Steroidobacteraceae bacterium]|nr:hypothetical protein [Steroidobacteraceae bacterium]
MTVWVRAGQGLLMAFALALFGLPAQATSAGQERAHAFEQHLPDWTGQWEIVGVTPDASGGFVQSLHQVVQAMRKWGPPPYKPAVQISFDRARDAIRKRVAAADNGTSEPDPGLRPACTFGFPMLMVFSPLMFEILTTPEETAMIFSSREIRHVYTDGRAHTPKTDLWPTPWGDSIGHWEGQTLVVDTIEVNNPPGLGGGEGPVIVAGGGDSDEYELIAVFSSEAHFIERIRMLDENHLEDRMTIEDPKDFTRPWHITRQYQRVTRIHRMVYEDCEGEERNPVVDGRFTLTPPPKSPSEK